MKVAAINPNKELQDDVKAALRHLLDRAERGELLSLVAVVESVDGYQSEWAGLRDKFKMMGALTNACIRLGMRAD